MASQSKIILKRESKWSDSIRSYKVFLDNLEIGSISNGEEKPFEIPSGQHEIYLKIDWCGSNKLQFNLGKAQQLNFVCGNTLSRWNSAVNFLKVLVFPNRYLFIRRE